MGTARTTDGAHQAAGQLAAARGELYRFLARQVSAPPGSRYTLKSSLWDAWDRCAGSLGGEPLLALKAYLGSTECTIEGLDREFVELFRLPTGRYLAPIESAYRCGGNGSDEWAPACLRGPSFHAVVALYRTLGFQPSFEPELEADHLACELAFLAYLCDAETSAWLRRDLTAARACRTHALEFLRRHPLRWTRALRRRFSSVSSDPYYDVTLSVLDEYLHLEDAQLTESETSA